MLAVGSTSLPLEGPGIYPATIKQLLRAERPYSEAKFSVDGVELGVITCVAGIVAISSHGSMKTYYLEDGSGGRLCAIWFQEPETSRHLGEQPLEMHNYVRVVGRLEVYNNTTELRVTHIRPVLDMHEPFLHLLDAMVASLSRQRPSPSPLARIVPGAKEPQSSPVMRRHFQDIDGPVVSLDAQEPTRHDASAAIVKRFNELTLSTHTSNLSDEDWFELESPPPSPRRKPSSPSPSSSPSRDDPDHRPSLRQDPYSTLSSLQREVMLQIQNNGPFFPEGVPIRAVFRRTISPRSGVNESDIRQAIDDLLDNGLLYSTIDQYHFKLVD
ncbi:hypothetical protein V8E53_001176 [Lactarius tabidus]